MSLAALVPILHRHRQDLEQAPAGEPGRRRRRDDEPGPAPHWPTIIVGTTMALHAMTTGRAIAPAAFGALVAFLGWRGGPEA